MNVYLGLDATKAFNLTQQKRLALSCGIDPSGGFNTDDCFQQTCRIETDMGEYEGKPQHNLKNFLIPGDEDGGEGDLDGYGA